MHVSQLLLQQQKYHFQPADNHQQLMTNYISTVEKAYKMYLTGLSVSRGAYLPRHGHPGCDVGLGRQYRLRVSRLSELSISVA